MSVRTITPQQLQNAIQSGQSVELVDVRTPVEFREVHADLARNVPLDEVDPAEFARRYGGRSEPVYVICRSGSRGRQACEKLMAGGFTSVVNVEGGTLAWDQAGLPVVRGAKMMSLERQVRIAAGLLVLTGTALGYWVNPLWTGLAAFVGAGLVFAGITDTCGMGLLLARMPWNRVPAASASPSASKTGSAGDAPVCSTKSRGSCCG